MSNISIGGCDFCDKDKVEVVNVGKMGRAIGGFCACKECCEKCKFPWPEDNSHLEQLPICQKCGSNSQVWINQDSGELTCHRLGCHKKITRPYIRCHQCDKLIPAEKTHNGISSCWLGHCCGFGQDAAIGDEIYI
ncbi:MAG: hypothetical protein M0R32_10450 [Candidatus Cloacimonetes bacterium]|jgi:hypothetical protein|nr:hypothetical protein [Candidatus Cloacimonadota bacterium]